MHTHVLFNLFYLKNVDCLVSQLQVQSTRKGLIIHPSIHLLPNIGGRAGNLCPNQSGPDGTRFIIWIGPRPSSGLRYELRGKWATMWCVSICEKRVKTFVVQIFKMYSTNDWFLTDMPYAQTGSCSTKLSIKMGWARVEFQGPFHALLRVSSISKVNTFIVLCEFCKAFEQHFCDALRKIWISHNIIMTSWQCEPVWAKLVSWVCRVNKQPFLCLGF